MKYNETCFYHHIYFPQIETEAKLDNILPMLDKIDPEGLVVNTGSPQIDGGLIGAAAFDSRRREFKRCAFWFKRYAHELHVCVQSTLGKPVSQRLAEQFDFDFLQCFDGLIALGIPSPHDVRYHRYLRKLYRFAASVKPKVVWVVDDGAAGPERLGDFSNTAIKAFNRKHSRRVTRSSLIKELSKDAKNHGAIKQEWLAFNTAAMLKLCRIIRQAVYSVSPNTQLGLMSNPSGGFGFMGVDTLRVLNVLNRKGRRPWHCPIAPPSDSHDRTALVGPVATAAQGVAIAGPRIKSIVEINNIPFSSTERGAANLRIQSTLHLLCGHKRQIFSLYDDLGNYALHDIDPATDWARFQAWSDRLARCIPDRPALHGVRIYHSDNLFLSCRLQTKSSVGLASPQPWPSLIGRCGIPVCFQGDPDCWIVSGEKALAMSNDEIENVVRKGAIFDGYAAESLCHRGYGPLLGIKSHGPIEDVAAEILVNGQFAPSITGHRFSFSALPASSLRSFSAISPLCTEVTKLMVRQQPNQAAGTLIYQTSGGHRGVILPYSFGNGGCDGYVRSSRKMLMAELVQWIMRRRQCVQVGGRADVVPFYLDDNAAGRIILALLNLGPDPALGTTVTLGQLPAKNLRLRRFNQAGRWELLGRLRGPTYQLTIDGDLAIPAASISVFMISS